MASYFSANQVVFPDRSTWVSKLQRGYELLGVKTDDHFVFIDDGHGQGRNTAALQIFSGGIIGCHVVVFIPNTGLT